MYADGVVTETPIDAGSPGMVKRKLRLEQMREKVEQLERAVEVQSLSTWPDDALVAELMNLKAKYRRETGAAARGKVDNRAEAGYSLNRRSKCRIRGILSLVSRDSITNTGDFLWYTFTCTGRPGMPYNPETEDGPLTKGFVTMVKNLRKRYGVKSYLWVAERQKDTRAIHYHAVFRMHKGRYLDGRQVNSLWLIQLDKLGYRVYSDKAVLKYASEYPMVTDAIKKGCRISHLYRYGVPSSEEMYRKEFIQGRNRKELVPYQKMLLNPVDYEKVKDLAGIAPYLTKYVTKNDQKIYARNWSASKDLLGLKVKALIPLCEFRTAEVMGAVTNAVTTEIDTGGNSIKVTTWYMDDSVWEIPFMKSVMAGWLSQFQRTLDPLVLNDTG